MRPRQARTAAVSVSTAAASSRSASSFERRSSRVTPGVYHARAEPNVPASASATTRSQAERVVALLDRLERVEHWVPREVRSGDAGRTGAVKTAYGARQSRRRVPRSAWRTRDAL